MIASVVISAFKAHERTEVALSKLTVLVGPKGSGKTSVLEALHLLGQLPQLGSTEAVEALGYRSHRSAVLSNAARA